MQDRAVVTIVPAYQGWQLFDGYAMDRWFHYKMSAIQAADALAKKRYEKTGQPTGVKVQMQGGDWIMTHCHG